MLNVDVFGLYHANDRLIALCLNLLQHLAHQFRQLTIVRSGVWVNVEPTYLLKTKLVLYF